MSRSKHVLLIGAFLGLIFKPAKTVFCWWRQFSFWESTYFLMPNSLAIFTAIFLPGALAPYVYVKHFWILIAAMLLSPFTLLSLVKIRNGDVVYVSFFLFLPYWIKKISVGSAFELYEAWEDPAPSGVAFEIADKVGSYVHLGTTTSAEELYAAISSELTKQGWINPPNRTWVLVHPNSER